jgi:hypothetical protein
MLRPLSVLYPLPVAYVPRQNFGDRHPQLWLVQDRQLDACSSLELEGQTRNLNESVAQTFATPFTQTSPSPEANSFALQLRGDYRTLKKAPLGTDSVGANHMT